MAVRIVVLVAVLLMLAFIAGFVGAEVAQSASCQRLGAGQRSAPDNLCTPGAGKRLTRAQVCTPKEREYIPADTRQLVLANYGLPAVLPYPGKIDHRWPHFLGGYDTPANLWPAPVRSFDKDRLEYVVYRRVCHGSPFRMRVRTAVRIFLSDWRAGYNYYLLHRGERPR